MNSLMKIIVPTRFARRWLWMAVMPPCIVVILGVTRGSANDGSYESLVTGIPILDLSLSPVASASLSANPREYVGGSMRNGSNLFGNVGVRLNGRGTFRPIDQDPNLTVKLDHFVAGRSFHGANGVWGVF